MIYLDNAATSFPKPPAVAVTVADFLTTRAGNPGRSGHALARAAQATVAETRRLVADLFGVSDPSRVAFALNATDAINLALWGLLEAGDRVVTSGVEHNAVIRPLSALAERGVAVRRVRCFGDGALDLEDLRAALAEAPTKLVVLTHASNVCGTILPIREAATLAHASGALLLIDAAQTAGVLPIEVGALAADLLAFPGHKSLLGPTGTGGLYVRPGIELRPLRQGGTGTRSEDERQPTEIPEALEAGTVNTVGIAGLGAGIRYLREAGLEAIRTREEELTARLLAGLSEVPGVRVYGPRDAGRQVATVSLNLEGWEPVDLGAALDSSFDIAVRPGLHCAPVAHQTLGTFPQGTVRVSLGAFSTTADVDDFLAAMRAIAG